MSEFNSILQKYTKDIDINLSESHIEKFNPYLKLLRSYNQKFNLTSITSDREVAIKHFIDSLTIFKAIDIQDSWRVIDVGTGAGFPGMVLKLLKPEIEMTLIDSSLKKCRFLEVVKSALLLDNLWIVWGRAEDYGKNPDFREKYDLAVCRALGRLRVSCELCIPFVKLGGLFIAQKGKNIKNEIDDAQDAIMIFGGEVKEIIRLKLPVLGQERNIVKILKVSPTPDKYPRRAGIPEKRPI